MPRPDGPQFIAFGPNTPQPNWEHLSDDDLRSIRYGGDTPKVENDLSSLVLTPMSKGSRAGAKRVPVRNWKPSDTEGLPVHVQHQLDAAHRMQTGSSRKRSKEEIRLELTDPSSFDYPEKMN